MQLIHKAGSTTSFGSSRPSTGTTMAVLRSNKTHHSPYYCTPVFQPDHFLESKKFPCFLPIKLSKLFAGDLRDFSRTGPVLATKKRTPKKKEKHHIMPGPHKCYFDFCNRSFQRPANLKRHLKQYHKGDAEMIMTNFNNNNTMGLGNINRDDGDSYGDTSSLVQPPPAVIEYDEDGWSSPSMDTLPPMSLLGSVAKKKERTTLDDSLNNNYNNASLSMMLNPTTSSRRFEEKYRELYDTASFAMLEDIGVDLSQSSASVKRKVLSMLKQSARDEAVALYTTTTGHSSVSSSCAIAPSC